MKIILTAVNAKYIHSNLAVYTLQASAEKAGVFPEIREFTINQSKDSMLRSLFLAHADVVCVSCYIWNISIVEDLITEYHKISPETKIWLGGPEVSYHAEEMLEQYPFLDGIMKGEGEITFRELAVYYQNQENGTEGKTLEEIHGITYRDAEGAIKSNPWRPVMDLSEVDFPYANLKKFENPIEKMWSKMKSFLRKRKGRVAAELPEAVKAALETISTNDCKGWFHASGICVN